MNLQFTTIEGVEIGREKHIEKVLKVIQDRKQARSDILKRSEELKVRAAGCRHSDPVKSRMLEHRSVTLANEVYRMKKEDRKPMTYDQIRRSALLGKIALLADGAKK